MVASPVQQRRSATNVTSNGQTLVATNDSRLSDTRAPTAGTVVDASVASNAAIAQSKIADLPASLNTKAPLVSPSFSGTLNLINSTALEGNSSIHNIKSTLDSFTSYFLTATSCRRQ